ncbi:MAG: ClbS/DfsB family four-helix bundle protein [Chloroflexi bacterium CFX4]|nr:ClbS/DfsB family four-helix bundle protein [Chloroflexi bacterium CFX4]MDL1921709.1 ClbS/DfsB family four-helix bundle protein [Chloroflexi bacterium CFX3]
MNRVPPNTPPTKANLLHFIAEGWDDFTSYLATLSEHQLTVPTDLAGWTVKDHIMHLAMWENGVNAVLNRQPRLAAMGVDSEAWLPTDEINARIQQRFSGLPLADVLNTFQEVHVRLMATLEVIPEADLMLPYRHYVPGSQRDDPVFYLIVGNTFEHYDEHTPWIRAIVEQGA